MSALVTAIVILVLAVMSSIAGFAFCLWGMHMKIREIEAKEHFHNGQKWNHLMKWINS